MAGGKRELIDPGSGKRFVKRDANGRFTSSVDVGRSLSAESRQSAKKSIGSGKGDQGDQKRPKKKS